MKSSFSQILIKVTGGPDPIMTVKQVASVMRVHEQTVYSYKNDVSDPSYPKLLDLNEALIKRGFYDLAIQFMPENEGEANGCLDDESAEMIKLIARLYTAFQKGDAASFMGAVKHMRYVVDNFEEEGRRL